MSLEKKEPSDLVNKPTVNVENFDPNIISKLTSNLGEDPALMSVSGMPELATKEKLSEFITKVATRNEIEEDQSAKAIATLFSKGAANAGAPMNMQVTVTNKKTGKQTSVTKAELVNTLPLISEENNVLTLKMLAKTMAPDIIYYARELYKKTGFLMTGDLAKTIGKRLYARREAPLTYLEAICCASYCQHLRGLEIFANSDRIRALLVEDEIIRFSSQPKKTNKKGNQKPQKGEKKK
jgi:hypothetical protein